MLVERHLGCFRDHAFESAQETGSEKVITTVRIIVVKQKRKSYIHVKISRVSLAESMSIYSKQSRKLKYECRKLKLRAET